MVGVIPRFRPTDEALAEFRTLSSMLADVAFSRGAAFIDVEALSLLPAAKQEPHQVRVPGKSTCFRPATRLPAGRGWRPATDSPR